MATSWWVTHSVSGVGGTVAVDYPLAVREMTATQSYMATTYTDIREGRRVEITVEFVTRRALCCDHGRVHRLLVADRSGTQFPLLATPDADPLLGLQSGERYLLSGVLGAQPHGSLGDRGEQCPDCGGTIRPGQVVDTVDPAVREAATRLDLVKSFGIVDTKATVLEIPLGDTPVDDWIPIGPDARMDLPDRVCASCGRQFEARGTRYGRESDQRFETTRNGRETDRPVGPEGGGWARPVSERTARFGSGNSTMDPTRALEGWQAVASGYTPQPAAIDDARLLDCCRFDRDGTESSMGMFLPWYGTATSEHPLDGGVEQYLAVGLDTARQAGTFERPPLDLVVVLDVSRSMDCPVDAYSYQGVDRSTDGEETKLDAARRVLCTLVGQLREDDRLGIVLCNHQPHIAKPLRDIGTTDVPAVRRHLCEIAARGNTDLAAGLGTAVGMFAGDTQGPGREHRLVCATDAMPNTGTKGPEQLTNLVADAATRGIHTTFLGIGFDANAALARSLSAVRGANLHLVRSPDVFERRLESAFDRMVTPIVYDLAVTLEGERYDVTAVHGCPSAAVRNRLVHVGTLFPGIGPAGRLRGGFVLLRLEGTNVEEDLELTVSWTERGGGEYTDAVTVDIPERPGAATDDAVRAAVALARSTRELRAWAEARHRRESQPEFGDTERSKRDRHARSPVPLAVSEHYARRFDRLRASVEDELVCNTHLERRMELLEELCELTRPTVTS